MTYNLTNVIEAVDFGTFAISMNEVSTTWIFSSLLITMFLLIMVLIKLSGGEFITAIFSSSLFCVFVGAIMLYFGGIGIILFSIFMALSIFMLFAIIIGGR